jgi:hypothetical protein
MKGRKTYARGLDNSGNIEGNPHALFLPAPPPRRPRPPPDDRGPRAVTPCGRQGERVFRLVALDIDDELAAFRMQLAALEHVAVDRIAIDRIIHEVAIAAIKRDFPELRDRRHVVEIEGDRVPILAREWATLRIVDPENADMRMRWNGSENRDR